MIYVKMNYSVIITDSQGKEVGGSWDIPITFTVKKQKMIGVLLINTNLHNILKCFFILVIK